MTEENKAIVRRGFDEMNRRNLNVYDELFAPDYVGHAPPSMGPKDLNLPARVQIAKAFLGAFPDLRHTIDDDLIAESDKVVARFTVSGTHKGDFRGMPPTGKRFEVPGTVIFRIANGKIAEEWALLDALSILQQLGALPPPGQPKGAVAPPPQAP